MVSFERDSSASKLNVDARSLICKPGGPQSDELSSEEDL